MLKDFAIAQRDYLELGSKSDKIQYALTDIYYCNGIKEQELYLPIFFGTAKSKKKEVGEGNV